MADISKITLPNGTTYDLKDAQARSDIEAIEAAIAGGVTFIGETTTETVLPVRCFSSIPLQYQEERKVMTDAVSWVISALTFLDVLALQAR